MINIRNLVDSYRKEGYSEVYSNAKAAQDIILTYLYESKFRDHVTIKGGVVMYNLSHNARRATVDIDIDLIKLYLGDDNLCDMFTSHKMEGITITIDKNKIVDLRQQDYHGKRLQVKIKDEYNYELEVKLDIGDHTEFNIAQDEIYFNSCIEDKKVLLNVNSKEQIFVEKIIPIVKFGLLSTRYKDFYDIYWLIENVKLDRREVRKILDSKIFNPKLNDINNLDKLYELINKVLSDSIYLKKLSGRKSNWLDINNIELKNTILTYIESLKH